MKAMKNWIRLLIRRARALVGRDVYYPVEVHGLTKARYGSDYGGYVICPDRLSSESIVYSFGCGDDISFDLDVIGKHGCSVYAYDPSPEARLFLASQALPKQFRLHEIALGSAEGVMKFYPSPNRRINYSLIPKIADVGPPVDVPVARLCTILNANGHGRIDLLKIDIEGAEFEVLTDIFTAENIEIDQLVIEFHHKHKEFSRNGLSLLVSAISLLKQRGFKIFDVSPGGIEYSFIRQITTS